MDPLLSPTGVAVLLLLALTIDYMSVGPNSLRDRIAFLMAIPAIRQGFDGSPLDQWTVGALSKGIDGLKDMAGTAYIAGAATSVLLGAFVGILAIFAVGCLLPDRFSNRLGRFATVNFPVSPMHRINWKLWLLAALIALMAELPGGIVGQIVMWAVDGLVVVSVAVPSTLFGVI